MATIRGAMLLWASTPYSRKGVLGKAYGPYFVPRRDLIRVDVKL
jgi:hypothetical protein